MHRVGFEPTVPLTVHTLSKRGPLLISESQTQYKYHLKLPGTVIALTIRYLYRVQYLYYLFKINKYFKKYNKLQKNRINYIKYFYI